MSCQTSGRFCYSCQDSLSTSRVRMGSNSMGFGFDAELLTVQRRESAKANQATSQPESRLPSRKSRRSLLPAPKTFVNPNLRTLSSPEPVQTSLAPSSSSSASDSALYVLQIGDRVSVSGYKTGTLKFKGQTTFAQGEWYGVALDEPAGKHNGCIDGVQYFQCQGKHGIFVPVHKIQPLNSQTVSYASTPPAFTGESSSNSNTSADSASSYPKQQKSGKPPSRILPPRVSSGKTTTAIPSKLSRPKNLPSLGKSGSNSITTKVNKDGKKIEAYSLTSPQTSTQANSPSPESFNISGSKLFQPRKISPVKDQIVSPCWSANNPAPVNTATVTKKTTRLPKIQGRKSLLPKVNTDPNSTFTFEDSKFENKFTLPPTSPGCQHSLSEDADDIGSLELDDHEVESTTHDDSAAEVNGVPLEICITNIFNGADENLNETFEITVKKKLVEEAHSVQALDGTFTLATEETPVALNRTFDAQNTTFNTDDALTDKTEALIPVGPSSPIQPVVEIPKLPEDNNTPDLQLTNSDPFSFKEIQTESTPDHLSKVSSQKWDHCDISVAGESKISNISQKLANVNLPTESSPLCTSRLTDTQLQESFNDECLLPEELAVIEQVRAAEKRILSEALCQEDFQLKEGIKNTEFESSSENPLPVDLEEQVFDTGQVSLIDFEVGELPSPTVGFLHPNINTSTPAQNPRFTSVLAAEMSVANADGPDNVQEEKITNEYPNSDAILTEEKSEMEESESGKKSTLSLLGNSMEIPVDIIESHGGGSEPNENQMKRAPSKSDLQSDLISEAEACEQDTTESEHPEEVTDFGDIEIDHQKQQALSGRDASIEDTTLHLAGATKLQHTDSLEVSVTESVELNGDVEYFAPAEKVSSVNGDVSTIAPDDKLPSVKNQDKKSPADQPSAAESDDAKITENGEKEECHPSGKEGYIGHDPHDIKTNHKSQENGDAQPDKTKESVSMPTKTDSPKKKSDVTSTKSSNVVIPPLKLGTGDKKTNGTDRNIVSPQRSFSSSSSISRSRERLTSPTGRRGSLDSSRGTSPARSSSESLPKKTYTPSSWRTDKPSSPPESKDRGVLSPRRRADLQILPPKLNFAAVKSKIDTGRKLGAKRDDKDGDDSFLKPEPLSQSFPPAKSADSAERASTFSNKLSKFEISSATSKGSKPINRTTQALRSNAATTKTGERRGSSSSIASDISQKSDISRGSRRSSTSSPRGAIGGGANNPIPLRLQSTSTSKLRPPQATTDSRSKSTSAGKGKPTSATASTAITTTTTTTTTSTTSTSKVPIRPSSKSLSRIKSAQSASSSSQNAAASSAASTANLTTSASSKALSAVRRGSEHGTQSTAGARQRPSSGRVLPATPSTTRKPADQNRERRGSARSKVTPSSTSQPDLVSTSIASENVSKEIKRLEALCEARTKELTLMKIQFKQGLTGFDAMATLVRYMAEELDAFSGPLLSQKLQVLQKEVENARQLIAKQEKELSDLHTEKTTLSEKYEDEVDKLKTETDELKEQHKKETEALTTKLNDEHKTNLETLEENLKKNHDEEKESLLEKHSQELVKARSDYASNLQRIKAQHREELSELTRIQKLTLEETVDEYKEKLFKQSSEHQQLVDGMTQEYTSKMKKLTTDFETKNRTLQDEVETLTFQCQNYKDRVKTLEENLHRDVDVKLQLALAPYKDLQAEVESLKCVLELKRVEMQELRSQKNELSKQLEKIPEMEETIKKLEAKNESLNASLEKKVSYERQLSSEHLVLREHFEKETQVNKRLSRENEELVWKLQNSDSGSPLTGLTPSSTRSTLSPSPTHSHPHGHLHRDSHTLSRSSSTDSHESGVFPLSPSQ